MSSLIINYAICIAISSGLSYFLYKILYSAFQCTNLNELVISSVVFANYNKNIDFAIFFVYLALFCIVFGILKKIIPVFEIKDFINDIKLPEHNGNKHILDLLQTLCTFMYFLLYPNNGNNYPILLFIIILLIIIANADIYFKIIFKNRKISPFAIAPLAIFLFGKSYNFGTVSVDDYHMGEKFATYWLYHFQHFQLFKDINLIHGYNDLFSGFVANKIFNEYTIYSFYLAETLIYNINLIITVILGYIIFSKNPILITGIFVNCFYYFNVYFLTGLLFLKKELIQNHFRWLQLYIICAFLMTAFWVHIGIFLFLALLPLAVYLFLKLFKQKQFSRIFYLILLSFAFSLLFKDFILNSFNYHLISNPLSYANGFPDLKLHQIWSDFIKLFALLAMPCFVVEGFKAYKNKNIQLTFIYIFAILIPLLGLTYELTRIDYIMFSRIRFISIAYITILLPFIFNVTKSIWLKYTKYIFGILLIILCFLNFTDKWDNTLKLPEKNIIPTIGNIKLEDSQQKRLENVKKIIDKYSGKDDYILDLTNRGLYYFYFERKIPCNMISYFNFTSKKEEQIALEQIKQNPPKIIILKSDNILHDEIKPALRINSIYKWILDNNYKILEDNDNIFLIKSEKSVKYNKKELKLLDEILSNNGLKNLPQSWGNSLKSLNLKDGKDLLFIELETNYPNKLEIGMKNSESKLFFSVDKKTTSVLIPLDNFVSWYLNPNEIGFSPNKDIKIKNIKYFKRQ